MILIIGIDGLLGSYLYKFLKNHFKVIGTSRKNLGKNIFSFDILNPISDLKIEWEKVDYVIITAACSNVDFCELNPNYSKKVNFVALLSMYLTGKKGITAKFRLNVLILIMEDKKRI